MKKYKIINVYTGYAENSIQDMELGFTELSLHDFTDMVGERLLKNIVAGGEFGDESECKEFFGFSATVDVGDGEVGTVANGEEGMLVIVPEAHAWYSKAAYDMSDEVYEEWVAYIEEITMMA
jgi:hypothetical protein